MAQRGSSKLPSSIKTAATEYTVHSEANDFLAEEADEGDNILFGRTNHLKGTIHIRPGASASKQRETMMHEVLHTVCFVSGLSHELDAEEGLVRRLTPVLLQVIRDNPELVEYLRAA